MEISRAFRCKCQNSIIHDDHQFYPAVELPRDYLVTKHVNINFNYGPPKDPPDYSVKFDTLYWANKVQYCPSLYCTLDAFHKGTEECISTPLELLDAFIRAVHVRPQFRDLCIQSELLYYFAIPLFENYIHDSIDNYVAREVVVWSYLAYLWIHARVTEKDFHNLVEFDKWIRDNKFDELWRLSQPLSKEWQILQALLTVRQVTKEYENFFPLLHHLPIHSCPEIRSRLRVVTLSALISSKPLLS